VSNDLQFLSDRVNLASDGLLFWKNRPRDDFLTDRDFKRWNTLYSGKRVGLYDSNGYRVFKMTVRGIVRYFYHHRVVFALINGFFPPEVDHADMDRSNNSHGNLRAANKSLNMRNGRALKDGLKGAYKDKNRWYSRIRGTDGKDLYLGTFATEQDAHEAYMKAARQIAGEFARAC
jgi:hypothetical protein